MIGIQSYPSRAHQCAKNVHPPSALQAPVIDPACDQHGGYRPDYNRQDSSYCQ
jgi:hypothetical protein